MATPAPQSSKAVFTTGSTMRHVIVMTATSSVGLVSIFLVDAINLFYISLLGQQELAAAIGYSATIMFVTISVCVGASIATAALVGRALGAEDLEKARGRSMSSLLFVLVLTIILTFALYPSLPAFLGLLGASGETLQLAVSFMQIVVPSIPLMGIGICLSALLRARGDPKRAMYVTLSGGAAALVLDPILIFGLDLGITGAAIAIVLVRCILVIVGLWGVVRVHNMLGRLDLNLTIKDTRPFLAIALPAIATQLATPVGNAYVTRTIAEFGDDAVAGWAIIGRLLLVAFGVIFALSGSVGPILSQNYGAKAFGRVNSTMRDALIFTLVYCLAMWAILALSRNWIIFAFDATGEAAALIEVFCLIVAGSYLFSGALFVANAAFNNLGYPMLATAFNWGRATLGIIPFVMVGSQYGADGVLVAWGLGAVVFGAGAVLVAFRQIHKLPERDSDNLPAPNLPPSANSTFATGKAASFVVEPRNRD
ncbi:MAG: MATE family efflux transporter [Rhizobiaceae bacterium]